MTSKLADLEDIFSKHQLRLTKPRQAIFATMQAAETPLAIGDIIKRCQNVDRVSIYRTLDLFVKLGLVAAVPVGWKHCYELTNLFQAHHHHLYCTNCGRLIDIHSKKLEELIAGIAGEYDFTAHEHKFEVSGTCKDCSKLTT